MRGSYNSTLAGLRHAEQHGITPGEVWEVIGSEGRPAGRFLAVLVVQDEVEDDGGTSSLPGT